MRKLSYANVVATIALVCALAGGTAWAADKLITSPKEIGKGVVTNGKVQKGTLMASRLSDAARNKLQGAQGPAGPAGQDGAQGPQGPAGPQGVPGENGATDVVIRSESFRIPVGVSRTGQADCMPGEVAVGGGIGLTNGIPGEFSVWSSRPVDAAGDSPDGGTPTGWIGSARNLDPDGPGDQAARVWVVCAAP